MNNLLSEKNHQINVALFLEEGNIFVINSFLNFILIFLLIVFMFSICFYVIKVWFSPRTEKQKNALKNYYPQWIIVRGTPEFENYRNLHVRDRSPGFISRFFICIAFFIILILSIFLSFLLVNVSKDVKIEKDKIVVNKLFSSRFIDKKDVANITYKSHKYTVNPIKGEKIIRDYSTPQCEISILPLNSNKKVENLYLDMTICEKFRAKN